MVDEPIVSSEVDPPDTIPVTMASVEMATGPPAPPAAPEAPVLCRVLVVILYRSVIEETYRSSGGGRCTTSSSGGCYSNGTSRRCDSEQSGSACA